MAEFKVGENTELLVAFRDNILAIINAMEAMGGVMAQMPQLPVRWAAGWGTKGRSGGGMWWGRGRLGTGEELAGCRHGMCACSGLRSRGAARALLGCQNATLEAACTQGFGANRLRSC
jgi:hypothetical protein